MKASLLVEELQREWNPLWEYRDRGEGQCCGFALVSMRIRLRIHNFTSIRVRTKNFYFTDEKNPLFTKNSFVSRPPWRTSELYRRILQPLKKNIHQIKTWNFFTLILCMPSWIRFQLIKNQDQCRSLRIRIRIHNTGKGYNNLHRKNLYRCPSVRYSSPSFLH